MELPYANLQKKVWNPGATMPLVLPIQVVCNTDEAVLARHIYENARRPGEWVATQAAHHRPVVLCGSGPSLGDCLAEVRERVAAGALLYALNGAARYLADRGLMPDAQIILDAQRETAQLVGQAREHFFASQCHPDTFAVAPAARLWHLQIEGVDDLLPPYDKPFALIGAASSVGTTALVLAWVLGGREFHCYGYDSSNRGEESHAFRQPMNDGEPMCAVTFGGKTYRCSLTMKLQAERFPETARLLEREGCKVFVHGDGLLPDIWNAPVEALSEREKYARLWTMPAYRLLAPGEELVPQFLDVARPPIGSQIIDFGCGTGRASLRLHLAGMKPFLVDFVQHCRDVGAAHLPFIEHDLMEPLSLRAPYGLCTDVLEHIPPQDTRQVLRNVFEAAPRVFFSIDTKPDLCGAMINQALHVCLMHHEEWRALLSEYGEVTWERCGADTSLFYVERKD